MRRTLGLLVTLVLGLLRAPLASDAQPLKAVPRIGVLAPWARPPSVGIDAFQQRLRELGYVEGQHLTIEWRFTEGRDEGAHDLATELVQLRVAVIVASTNAHVLAARQATRTSRNTPHGSAPGPGTWVRRILLWRMAEWWRSPRA